MNEINTEEVQIRRRNRAYALLIFATFFMYIVLTGAKNLYVAEKTTLEGLGTFGSYTDLAATMEYYFYTYAVMQIVLSLFMSKLNIKWFLTITLGVSAIITILTAFTNTIIEHWILYAVNGVMQAGVWGCSIKVLSTYLPQRSLSTANKLMTSGPAVAGIVSYGTAALFGDNWTVPFILLGVILLVAVAFFFFSVTNVHRFPREIHTHHVVRADGTEEDVSDEDDNDFIHLNSKKRIIVFYVISILLGFAVTSLFFAMNNTLDIFLKQIGGFDNTVSKWLTTLAPIAFTVGPILCVSVCDKHKNFIKVGAVFFGLALVFVLLLVFFFDVNIILSLALILAFLVLTNGGRSISLSIAATKMRDKLDSGRYSTLVNAAASIASGVIPKLFTTIIDNAQRTAQQNWQIAFIVLVIFTVIVVTALLALILWIKYLNKKDEKSL